MRALRGAPSPYNPNTFKFSSGEVFSSFSIKYGYIEGRIRVKKPTTLGLTGCTFCSKKTGLWPAFWMWAAVNPYQEIDIFEYFGKTDIYSVTSHNGCSVNSSRTLFDFHTYKMEWTPTFIKFWCDGTFIFECPVNDNHKPMPIILNLALGCLGGAVQVLPFRLIWK